MSQGEEHLEYWLGLTYIRVGSFVYVIQGEPETPIKIGVAKDPLSRLRSLQTGNPQVLRLLHVIPGSYELESSLHARLRDSAVLGEWFGGPGVEEFLTWATNYAQDSLERHRETGRMPATPPKLKTFNRRGFSPGGWHSSRLGHRWRTSDGERENPVTVRFVKPEPRTVPTEIQAKLTAAAKAGFTPFEVERLCRELEALERRAA